MNMPSLIRRGLALAVPLASALLVACGGGGGGSAPPPGDPAPVVVGSAGGVVNGPDGVSVTIPAGALAVDTTLQIVASTPAAALALPAGITAPPRLYSLLPHGTRFSVPVTLRVPRVAGDPTDASLLKTNAAGTAWEQLVTTSAGDSHSALIVSFSYTMMCGACVQPGPPVISMQPASGSVIEGGLVFLSVSAIGAQPLHYTWSASSRGGTFGTQTSPGIVINPVTMADDGTRVRVTVTDRFGNTAQSDAGIVTVIPAAPVIVSEPIDVVAVEGTTAMFSALTTSSVAQLLNWQRYDPIGQAWGASLSSTNRLSLPNVSLVTDDQALFRMTAQSVGGGGPVFTRTARLTVLAAEVAPTIQSQPQDVATVAGRSATFGVVASGGGLDFDWIRSTDGGASWSARLPGSGSAQFVVSNATTADDGSLYRVVVRNTQNPAATSAVARLVVAPSVGSAPRRVDGGNDHTVALRADASLVAWGGNGFGQLGRGTFTADETPAAVAGPSRVATFAVGGQHTLAIDDQGVVSSWGSRSNGVLGYAAAADVNSPQLVPGLVGPARFVSAGTSMSLATTGNDYYSWGAGYHGDSLFAVRNAPTALSGYAFVVASAGRGEHTLAVSGDGTVWAWGHNSYGQLGTGDFGARIAPEPVTGLPRAVAVSAGVRHSLALSESGTVYAWGGNFSGELGTGDNADHNRPVAVPLPGIAVAIATGLFHSMALLADGRVYAWGYNDQGAVGRGDFLAAASPVDVAGAWSGRIVAIGAGERHSLAVDSAGAVWAWGLNDSRQLGDGTRTPRNRPVRAVGVNLQ